MAVDAATEAAHGVRESERRVAGRRVRLLEVDGPDPRVMLIHGTTDSADSHRPLLERLAGLHRAAAVDLRGHGGSDRAAAYELTDYAADVVALLEEHEPSPTILAGHSLGAMIAMFVASTRPELVAGVVLEDPPYFALLDPRRNHDAHWYQGWLRIRELLRARLDPAGFRAAVGELPAMIPGEGLRLRDVLGELEVAARAEVLRRVDAAVLDPVIEDRLLRGFPAAAFELRCPAALIAGSWRLGGVMTSEDVQRWLEHVPHGTATVLGDAGHLIHHRPDSRRAVLWHLGEVARRVDVRDRGFADSYGLDAAERNRQLAREEFEVWSTGELERLDSLVAEDVVHHDPHDPHAGDGLDGLKASISATRERFPEFEITVLDQVAEGEKVATRWRATMTPRAGATASMVGITIERFADGKVVEAWRSMDRLGLLRLLGVLPGPAAEKG
jgi:pimeloyl-ACP methyl ester carboxylesterase/ketosteroid isomerase-like protein